MGCKVQQRSANLEVRKYAVRLVLENIKKYEKETRKTLKCNSQIVGPLTVIRMILEKEQHISAPISMYNTQKISQQYTYAYIYIYKKIL